MTARKSSCIVNWNDEMDEDCSNPNAYQIYREIDENSNIFDIESEGGNITHIGGDFGNLIYEIEKLMQQIREGKYAFLDNRDSKGKMKPSALAGYLPLMNALLKPHSLSKIYSPSVALFFDICIIKYGLMPGDFCGNPNAYSPVFKMNQGEFFNKLIGEFNVAMLQREFKRKVYARKEAIERGRKSGEEYIGALFEKCARLLVIRVDFGFHSAKPLLSHTTTLNEAQKYFSRFLNNKRGKKLYANVVGYIWRLEYGKEKGYHYHLIFFFDGSKAHKDEYLASKIGEDWIRVTDGKGIYHNCNAHKQKYKRLGIGMISHDDREKRQNLLNVLAYMHKQEQTLREKHLSKTHCWGRGTLPKARRNGAGRPRRSQVVEMPRTKMGDMFSKLMATCHRDMHEGE